VQITAVPGFTYLTLGNFRNLKITKLVVEKHLLRINQVIYSLFVHDSVLVLTEAHN